MIKSQIFKTDQFYVENRNEKTMYLVNKSNMIFNKIANRLDRAKARREWRRDQRPYYYEFTLNLEHYQLKKLEGKRPQGLKKNEFKIHSNCIGVFKGSRLVLIDFLDYLYKDKTQVQDILEKLKKSENDK